MITEKNWLIDRGFATSNIDRFLFYKDGLVIIFHIDDACTSGTSQEKIDEFFESLKHPDTKWKKNFIYQDGRSDFTIEKSIEKMKAKLKSLQEEMDGKGNEDGWTILAELNEKVQAIQDDVDEKEMRWLELGEFLEEEEADST